MIGFIIWIVGVVLTIKAAIEIAGMNVSLWKRIVAIILILATSWLGLIFYYLIARGRMESWCGSYRYSIRRYTVYLWAGRAACMIL